MVKVLLSVDFLIELKKQDLKKFGDFEDPDLIASYLFFKELIYKKSTIYLDLPEQEIAYFKNPKLKIDELDGELRDKALIISTFRNSKINSGVDLFNKIKNKNYTNLNKNDIPEFLLLSNENREYCKKIEEETGISCFSIKYNRVPENLRRVQLEKLTDTMDAFFRKINMHTFNSLCIEDPKFIERHNTEENIKNFIEKLFITRLRSFKLDKLYFELRYKNEQISWLEIFKSELSNFNNLNNKVIESVEHNSAEHDRYIITNKHIIILGNSLNQTRKTYFTTYPKWLYYNFFN